MMKENKNKGLFLTAMVLVICFAMITISIALITPLTKNQELLFVRQENARNYYFAEAGWRYFKYLWKQKHSFKIGKTYQIQREIGQNPYSGYFKLELSKVKSPSPAMLYKMRISGGTDKKKLLVAIAGMIEIKKQTVKILEWKTE